VGLLPILIANGKEIQGEEETSGQHVSDASCALAAIPPLLLISGPRRWLGELGIPKAVKLTTDQCVVVTVFPTSPCCRCSRDGRLYPLVARYLMIPARPSVTASYCCLHGNHPLFIAVWLHCIQSLWLGMLRGVLRRFCYTVLSAVQGIRSSWISP